MAEQEEGQAPPAPEAVAPHAPPFTERAHRQGILERVARRTRASAEIVVPAVPSLVDHYVDMLADHFAALGRPFSPSDLGSLRHRLQGKAAEGLRKSPYSNLFIRYNTAPDHSLRIDYAIAEGSASLAEEYEHWVATREPPLFGKSPDARLLALLDELRLPASARCLDIGAGTGRNALALARRGHPVDAVEPAPALAGVLEKEIAAEGLSARVVRADVLEGPLPLPEGAYALALASQVTSHFQKPAHLRALLAALATALAPEGHALITVFLPVNGYRPDRAARETAVRFWSTFFTHDELSRALDGTCLRVIEDREACAFERAHLPPESWPPTSWYEEWARGEDVFGPAAPQAISLRWLLLRRDPGAVVAAR